MARQMREIEDAAFAKFAAPGDMVEGAVISYDPEGTTDFNRVPCPALTLDGADGPVTVTCDKPQLLRKVLAARPVPGLWMRVKFVEERESANGRWYKHFGVWVAADGDGESRGEAPRGRHDDDRPRGAPRGRHDDDRPRPGPPPSRPRADRPSYGDEAPF